MAEEDELSPFFGREYSEFVFSKTVTPAALAIFDNASSNLYRLMPKPPRGNLVSKIFPLGADTFKRLIMGNCIVLNGKPKRSIKIYNMF